MRRKLCKAVFIVLLSASSAVACPKGQSVWQDGCVVDIQPEIAKPVQPSDEVPPTDKMPSWQREGITIVPAASSTTADDDANADKAKRDADAQGRKAAGIK